MNRAQASWARLSFPFAAAIALAVVSLLALAPAPVAARAVHAGSAFSATTSDSCTLPRVEMRTAAQTIPTKGGGGTDGGAATGATSDCRGARSIARAGAVHPPTPPAHPPENHAAREAEARAPPRG